MDMVPSYMDMVPYYMDNTGFRVALKTTLYRYLYSIEVYTHTSYVHTGRSMHTS